MIDWPSTPDERGDAPPLATVLAGNRPESVQAGFLAAAIADLEKQDWKTTAMQIGVQSQHHGPFTVPAIITTGETPVVVFTYFGEWNEEVYKRFIWWLECVRTCPKTQRMVALVVSSHDPVELKKEFEPKHGVFFKPCAWTPSETTAQAAPEPKVHVFVDDRSYSGVEPWEQAAYTELLNMREKIVDVDFTGVLPFTSRPSKRFDPQKVVENPEAFQYYPKVLELQFSDGFDFERKLKVATNIMFALERVGCKAGVAVSGVS
jgi:hypothetical protein